MTKQISLKVIFIGCLSPLTRSPATHSATKEGVSNIGGMNGVAR
jgi:hypothetical protein